MAQKGLFHKWMKKNNKLGRAAQSATPVKFAAIFGRTPRNELRNGFQTFNLSACQVFFNIGFINNQSWFHHCLEAQTWRRLKFLHITIVILLHLSLYSIAFFTIKSKASSLKDNAISSISKSFLYCFTREFLGSVKIALNVSSSKGFM